MPLSSCVYTHLSFASVPELAPIILKVKQPMALVILWRTESTKHFTGMWSPISKPTQEALLTSHFSFDLDSHPCTRLADRTANSSCQEAVTTNVVIILNNRAFILSTLKYLTIPLKSSRDSLSITPRMWFH